mgnify:CR=1 FL=1
MKKVKNPFIVSGKIAPEYFCDRRDECARFIKSVKNGNNLVVISPRRMGKTGLINFCYQNQEISNEYYTFFIDLLHTTNLREFTYSFGKKVYESIAPASKKMKQRFFSVLKSLSGQFGFDPLVNAPTFSIELADVRQPSITLDEIFQYLEGADRPCLVTFDEFQQIAKYPEQNIEALLRTYIQNSANCNFIFAGSEYHIMQEMFLSAAHPFYNSTDILELKAINEEIYTEFVTNLFNERNRKITSDGVHTIYVLFRGNTYAMQKTFNEAYSLTDEGELCSKGVLTEAVENVIASKEPLFTDILSNVPEKQRMLLFAIAQEREVTQITSQQFIHSHGLVSSSANQHAARKLLESNIITKLHGVYSISEPFFELWINDVYGKKTVRQIMEEI